MEARKREILHYVISNGSNPFSEWLEAMRDQTGRAVVLKRMDRVEEGLLGDHRYVGEGVWELRIDYGPGYRVYYGEDGINRVILLLGGDKHSQTHDIRRAKSFWMEYRRNS